MIFDNLIDVKTGKPVEIDIEVSAELSKRLEKVREVAGETGKRFRKIFEEERKNSYERGKTVINRGS